MYFLGIEAFLVVVRTQNLSHAAEQLNLAQSTVSKRLQLLEQELGVVLIERGKGNKVFRLTSAGESFLDLAIRWQSLWQETQNFQSIAPRPRLYIGTILSISDSLFPELFRALSMHQPTLNLKVKIGHSTNLYDLLERREIDVAFTSSYREHPQLIAEKYHTEPLVGLCKITSDFSVARTIHPHELDPDNQLFLDWGLIYKDWHNQWWKPSSPGTIILDTPQLIRSFLITDHHWVIIPLSIAKVLQKSDDYHIFYFSDPPPNRVYYKITHKYPNDSTKKAVIILNHYLDKLEKGLLSQDE